MAAADTNAALALVATAMAAAAAAAAALDAAYTTTCATISAASTYVWRMVRRSFRRLGRQVHHVLCMRWLHSLFRASPATTKTIAAILAPIASTVVSRTTASCALPPQQ